MLGVVIAVMAFTPLVAQDLKMNGFAGEDKVVLFPEDDPFPTKFERVGTNDPNPDCVFHWSVISHPEGASYSFNNANVQQPLFTFNKATGIYVLEVTRVSKFGYQREYVSLEVKSEIELLVAISRKDCWSPGDPVRAEDFELTTNPPGYDDRVVVHPDDTRIKEDEWWYKDIRFRIHNPGDVEDKDCDVKGQIFIANLSIDDIFKKFDEASELWNSIKGARENYQKIKTYCRVIKGCKKKLEGFATIQKALNKITPPGSPYRPIDTTEINTVDMDINMQCCNNETVIFLAWDGGVTFYRGFEIDVPLWPGIPKMGFQLVGGLGAGVKTSVNYQISLPKYYECFRVHIPCEVYGVCSLGLKLMALADELLKVSATLSFGIHGESDIVFVPKIDWVFNGVYLDFDITVETVLIGFNKKWHPYKSDKIYLIEGEKQ